MTYTSVAQTLWFLQVCLLGALAVRAWRARLHEHLPVFVIWLAWAVISNIPSAIVVLVGAADSELYVNYFTWSTVITYGVQLALCWEVYSAVRTPDSALPWAAMTITLGLLTLDQIINFQISIYWLSHIVPLHLQIYFVFAILFKLLGLPRESLSRNLSGLICYLMISNGIQYFAYSAPAFGILPYEVVRWFLQPGFLVATFVLFKYMRGLDLPIRAAAREVHS